MADAQERIGQSIGDYRLLRLLGKGTFGTVYLAEHLHDHTSAAVKVLHIPLTGHDALHAFLNEARTVRLRHPHIVPILDFGLSRRDDLPYLVMAYADGGTLRDRYPKGSKLSNKTIDTYVQQLASALQYAHDHRVIHRDVKPENMLVSGDGTVQLSDFGIAKISELASLSSQHKVAGTPAYAAPEQSQGKPCPASDQYALAVVVYEWLTGQRPFQGDPLAVMLQHHMDAPPSLRSICPRSVSPGGAGHLQSPGKSPGRSFPYHYSLCASLACCSARGCVPTQPLPNLDQSRSVPSSIVPVPPPPPINTGTFSMPFVAKPSRRTFLFVGACTLIVGTGGLIWVLHQSAKSVSSPMPSPINSPTPVPIGKTFFTFPAYTIAWSPDGKYFASGGEDTQVRIWDASTYENRLTCKGHSQKVNVVAWSPDGKYIASASDDKTVRVWDATTANYLSSYGSSSKGVGSLAWSSDSKRIVEAVDDTLQIWDITTSEKIFTDSAARVSSVAWSPNGKYIVGANGVGGFSVRIWDANTAGMPLRTYENLFSGAYSSPFSVVWSPDSKYLASGGSAHVNVWDASAAGEALRTYRGDSHWIHAVAWSPDGKYIASGGDSKTVHIWDANAAVEPLYVYTRPYRSCLCGGLVS